MKKSITVTAISVVIAFGLLFFFTRDNVSSFPQSAQAEEVREIEMVKVYPVKLPKYVEFCNEAAPMSDRDVQERLDRELLINTYWQSQTLLMLKEYNKLKPMLEPILRKNGVPSDFLFLAAAESGFRNVVSPAGATGVWQIMAETGRRYGLEINDEVDERYHFVKSTEAATKYLNDAKKKFGNWTMAAASYNMGMEGLRRVQEQQLADSYYDMMLSSETQRYVFRVMALKEVLSKPHQYGFQVSDGDLYPPYDYDVVKVDSTIPSLARFAKDHNISYKDLKILNPWLRSYKLTNAGKKTYEIFLLKKPS